MKSVCLAFFFTLTPRIHSVDTILSEIQLRYLFDYDPHYIVQGGFLVLNEMAETCVRACHRVQEMPPNFSFLTTKSLHIILLGLHRTFTEHRPGRLPGQLDERAQRGPLPFFSLLTSRFPFLPAFYRQTLRIF